MFDWLMSCDIPNCAIIVLYFLFGLGFYVLDSRINKFYKLYSEFLDMVLDSSVKHNSESDDKIDE